MIEVIDCTKRTVIVRRHLRSTRKDQENTLANSRNGSRNTRYRKSRMGSKRPRSPNHRHQHADQERKEEATRKDVTINRNISARSRCLRRNLMSCRRQTSVFLAANNPDT